MESVPLKRNNGTSVRKNSEMAQMSKITDARSVGCAGPPFALPTDRPVCLSVNPTALPAISSLLCLPIRPPHPSTNPSARVHHPPPFCQVCHIRHIRLHVLMPAPHHTKKPAPKRDRSVLLPRYAAGVYKQWISGLAIRRPRSGCGRAGSRKRRKPGIRQGRPGLPVGPNGRPGYVQ